jgi:DNA-directed RNA polymerase subunit M/transcription elongation factor TFIIS
MSLGHNIVKKILGDKKSKNLGVGSHTECKKCGNKKAQLWTELSSDRKTSDNTVSCEKCRAFYTIR